MSFMSMFNMLDLIVLVLFAAFIIKGFARGFLKEAFSFCKLILAFVAAYLFGSLLSGVLYDYVVYAPTYNAVFDKVNAMYAELGATFNIQAIKDSFPAFLQTEGLNESLASLSSQGDALVADISHSFASPIASLISSIIGYVLVFVVALIALSIVVKILSATLLKLKLFGFLDHVLGAAWGLLFAFIVVCLFSTLCSTFLHNSPLYMDSSIVCGLGESGFLETFEIFNIREILMQHSVH